eukprot:4313003-Alexandrium_andersonii.AAC.1
MPFSAQTSLSVEPQPSLPSGPLGREGLRSSSRSALARARVREPAPPAGWAAPSGPAPGAKPARGAAHTARATAPTPGVAP